MSMKAWSLLGNSQKLDGGAMFGVVPKVIWQRSNPADANNLIDMSSMKTVSYILIMTNVIMKNKTYFFISNIC